MCTHVEARGWSWCFPPLTLSFENHLSLNPDLTGLWPDSDPLQLWQGVAWHWYPTAVTGVAWHWSPTAGTGLQTPMPGSVHAGVLSTYMTGTLPSASFLPSLPYSYIQVSHWLGDCWFDKAVLVQRAWAILPGVITWVQGIECMSFCVPSTSDTELSPSCIIMILK